MAQQAVIWHLILFPIQLPFSKNDMTRRETTELEKIQKAIALLESQQDALGRDVVRMAMAPLKEKLAALSARPASRRRIVTVFFADVQNFTALSEQLDMEVVRDTMHSLWKQVDALITARGGVVDKHMGDSVMAVWGMDAIHEDDPERAVRASLDIQALLKGMGSESSRMPIVMRIGIHTGLAMVDTSGGSDATVLGDTVNLAARLEKSAPPASILISHETYRQVRGLFSVEALSPVRLRGKTEPVRTYRVVDAKPLTFRQETRGVEGIETNLVGRSRELQALQQAFQAIRTRPEIRQITIVGEAGLGKSRLMYEFLDWVELEPTDVWLFRGRASASMMDSPYSFLREVFSLRFQIQDDASTTNAHAKFEQGLSEFLSSADRLAEKARFIGHLIGLDYSGSPEIQAALKDPREFQRQAIFHLTQFFNSVALKKPILLIFDDMHWVDGASLSALKSLGESFAPDACLLTLCATRPTLFERYDWPVGMRLELHPLSKVDSHELVGQLLRQIPNPPAILQELLVNRAEGNPFYLEELIKMLIDTGVILTNGEQWRVASERLVNMRIPATLVEVLQARLDDLQPSHLAILQCAAVLGRVFWDDAVAFLAKLQNPQSLSAIFKVLEQKELIFPSHPSAFVERREYRFKHTILCEVTYETVLKRQRPGYHTRAAQWLENAAGERSAQYIPQIAEHYEKALQTEQAAITYLKAARRSTELAAYSEASSFLERGLKLANTLPENRATASLLAELRVHWSSVLSHMGAYPDAQAQAEAALLLARKYNLDALASEALANLGYMVTDQGEYDRAEVFLAEALPLARASNDQKTQCFVLSSLAYVNARRANWSMAERYYFESRDLALQIDDTERYFVALNGLGIVARYSARTDAARQYWEEIVTLGLPAGYRFAVMSALNNLGSLCDEVSDMPGAIRYYEQALVIATESGSRQREALLAANMGEAYLKLKNLPDARKYLHTALEISWQLQAWPIILGTVVFFSRWMHAEGRLGRALALLGAARAHPALDGDARYEIEELLREWGLDESTAAEALQVDVKLDWKALVEELIDVK